MYESFLFSFLIFPGNWTRCPKMTVNQLSFTLKRSNSAEWSEMRLGWASGNSISRYPECTVVNKQWRHCALGLFFFPLKYQIADKAWQSLCSLPLSSYFSLFFSLFMISSLSPLFFLYFLDVGEEERGEGEEKHFPSTSLPPLPKPHLSPLPSLLPCPTFPYLVPLIPPYPHPWIPLPQSPPTLFPTHSLPTFLSSLSPLSLPLAFLNLPTHPLRPFTHTHIHATPA